MACDLSLGSIASVMHHFKSWIWAIENLKTLHYNSIIFASDDHHMIGAISKPAVLHDLSDWNVAV